MARKKITDWSKYSLETRAIRAGYNRTQENEHSEAIFTTSSYVFDDAESAARKFSNSEEGNVYSRFTNPTVNAFERRLASLDGADSAVATASGMGAITLMALSLLKAGDHVICSRSVFGSITILFDNILTRFGIDVTFVSPLDINAWKSAITSKTKIFFAETPSNPLQELINIRELSDLAHNNNALLVVDNGFCTPALQRPIEQGADLTVYTTTKYIDGQGRCVGGAICGEKSLICEKVYTTQRTVGTSMSPFNAWVFMKGLETLSLRMNEISKNALVLAKWLELHPKIEKVHYTYLESHAQYHLAQQQQSAGGGIVTFEIKGDKAAAFKFIDNTAVLSLTGNLGDVKSIITHPASTTHGRLPEQDRLRAGIKDNLIRISVGLESINDIIEDISQGLDALD